jgi:glycosyltransferase involved in cell wall biosynthesis
MEQFVRNAVALGHEVWAYPNNRYSEARIIPTTRFAHIRRMRQMDALYVRLESRSPELCGWSLPPRRLLYNFPLVVWEFNTIPDDATFRGESAHSIKKVVDTLRHYGRGCDLAICVAPVVADYVQEKLGIMRTLIVPNGSDPELFSPDIQPVKRMQPFRDAVNIVWIGSAGIKYHDFDLLQDTANLIWERGKGGQVNFHIIGPNLIGAMAYMPPNVYYWGAETYQKLPSWLSAMDIGLYITRGGTSVYGSPLKVFDYMASGLAIVSTTHPFVGDLFDQLKQCDLMVPSGDANALADVLINLISDRERMQRQGSAGRKLVIDHYNWRRAVQDSVNEMETILKGRKRKNY